MRADRLLSLMFLLQSKQRMTAEELAQSLGVSQRTIYRDIDALTLTGVPIYTQDGRNGGISLDEHYRISLTGLKPEEIQSLFISTTSGPLHDLGLKQTVGNALLKLMAALPLRHRDEAEHMRQRVHFDPSDWFYQRDVSQWMPQLLQAVFGNRKLWLCYRRANGTLSERVIYPYGLVAKANIWYLVARTDEEDEMRTFRVSRFEALRILDETFTRSPSFDLAAYWRESTHHYEESKARYAVCLRVAPHHPGVTRYLCEAYGAQVQAQDQQHGTTLSLSLAAMEEARMVVMGMGDRVEIVHPPELREDVRQWARRLLDHYGE